MKIASPFGIGTLHMGTLLDRTASREVILKAIEKGVCFFDTAPLYGNGKSEEILGDILSEIRSETIITTKVGLQSSKRKDGRFGVEITPLTEKNMRTSLEESLRKLKRETIDIFMLHAFDSHTPIDLTLDALVKFYKEGKIKSFGCSNYNPTQLRYLLAHKPDNLPFVATQCHYNLIERRASKALIPICNKEGIWTIVNRALARGALTGQYGTNIALSQNSRAFSSPRIRKWLTKEKLKLLDALSLAAKTFNLSLMQASLHWLLKNHSQMVILLGTRDVFQLEACLQVINEKIDDSILYEIEKIIKSEKYVYEHPPRYFEK